MLELRGSKLVLLSPSKEVALEAFQLERDVLQRIAGLVTGYCHLRKHLHRIAVFNGDPVCRIFTLGLALLVKEPANFHERRRRTMIYYVNCLVVSPVRGLSRDLILLPSIASSYISVKSVQYSPLLSVMIDSTYQILLSRGFSPNYLSTVTVETELLEIDIGESTMSHSGCVDSSHFCPHVCWCN
ncbi:hypothetical protein J6590_103581 [Homalodisca vitripennis]|nr:hypothetical protein J6590_103581 [Homalodisca vitripennis]